MDVSVGYILVCYFALVFTLVIVCGAVLAALRVFTRRLDEAEDLEDAAQVCVVVCLTWPVALPCVAALLLIACMNVFVYSIYRLFKKSLEWLFYDGHSHKK